MQETKILIFGVPGSGKTTLAKKLANLFSIPILHIDKHFFLQGFRPRPEKDFLQDVALFLEKEAWVIEGNAISSLQMRYKKASIVVYCNLNRFFCLYRIIYRSVFARSGQEDLPEKAMHTISWSLVKYLWKFAKNYENTIQGLQNEYPNIVFIELQSKKQMHDFYNNVKSSFNKKSRY